MWNLCFQLQRFETEKKKKSTGYNWHCQYHSVFYFSAFPPFLFFLTAFSQYTSESKYFWGNSHTGRPLAHWSANQTGGQRQPEQGRRGRRDEANRESHRKAFSQLPYALTKIPTAAASPGSCSSLAPHPAVVETHLAPCWTFIRPVSHQMVPCSGSGVVWPCAGGSSHSLSSAGTQGLEWSRCQGATEVAAAKGAWSNIILYVGTWWHKIFGKRKGEKSKSFKVMFNLTSTENNMEWKIFMKQKAKRKMPEIFTWDQPSVELTLAFFFFFLTSGL